MRFSNFTPLRFGAAPEAILALLCALLLTGCADGYYRHFDQSPVRYEILADQHANVYRAAYEICRWWHRSGYIVLRQPLPDDGWNFMGRFQCAGEFDPTLAVRYEYLDTAFKPGHVPLVSGEYFRFNRRLESDNRGHRIRTNTLNEEPTENFMRGY